MKRREANDDNKKKRGGRKKRKTGEMRQFTRAVDWRACLSLTPEFRSLGGSVGSDSRDGTGPISHPIVGQPSPPCAFTALLGDSLLLAPAPRFFTRSRPDISKAREPVSLIRLLLLQLLDVVAPSSKPLYTYIYMVDMQLSPYKAQFGKETFLNIHSTASRQSRSAKKIRKG